MQGFCLQLNFLIIYRGKQIFKITQLLGCKTNQVSLLIKFGKGGVLLKYSGLAWWYGG